MPSNESRPHVFLWCRWIASRPGLLFGLLLSAHISTVLISIVLSVSGYDVLAIVFDEFPLDIQDDMFHRRSSAWEHRNDDLLGEEYRRKRDLFTPSNENRIRTSCPGGSRVVSLNPECSRYHVTQRSSRKRRDTLETVEYPHMREYLMSNQILTLLYRDPNGGNIFTQDNLRTISQFEYDLYNMQAYQLRYCMLIEIVKALSCAQFSSVLRFFDGIQDEDLFDPSLTNVTGLLIRAYGMERTRDDLLNFISVNSVIDPSNGVLTSDATRSAVLFGYPLEELVGNPDIDHIERESQNILGEWAESDLRSLLDGYVANGVDGLEFRYFLPEIYWGSATTQVVKDWVWILGGICFIFAFIWFQTGSLFITSFGVLSILFSFVGANLIYRCIVGYRYFGIFNVLSVFIILGIGADDIFIFTDTWKMYSHEPGYTLEEKLSVVYARAAKAMFVTSLTTMVAFFVNSFSPLLPVSAFGTYSGLCIFVNYISVITFYPSVVLVYHTYFTDKLCLCCGSRSGRRRRKTVVEKTNLNNSQGLGDSTNYNMSDNGFKSEIQNHNGSSAGRTVQSTDSRGSADDKDNSNSDRINAAVVKFFATHYFNFITKRIVQAVVYIVFFFLVVGACYMASTIKIDKASIRLFDNDDPLEQALEMMTNGFLSTNGERTEVLFVWGLGEQDMGDCNRLQYVPEQNCEGSTVWDEEHFDLNDPESQIALRDFCLYLRDMPDAELLAELSIAPNPDGPGNDIDCFLLDMETFYQEESGRDVYPSNTSFSLPLTLEKVQFLMDSNPEVYAPLASQDISRPFEIALEFWLSHRHTNETIPDNRAKFQEFLGRRRENDINLAIDEETESQEVYFGEDAEIYQSRLVYTAIRVGTTLEEDSLDIHQGVAGMEAWEQFAQQQFSQMPPPLQYGFQQSETWAWMRILQNLVSQSFIACGVGLSLAFVVIVLGTTNFLSGFIATVLLVCVTICVVAIIPLAGWKFGLIEALNLCLIVGLAVDYVVHFTEGYHLSAYSGRLDRTRDTLRRVGISVLSGAVTTLGSSFFMIFAKLLFFKQFAVFIFCTIGFSVVFSLFVLIATYSLIGPEGYNFSFMKYCRKRQKYNEQEDESVREQIDCPNGLFVPEEDISTRF